MDLYRNNELDIKIYQLAGGYKLAIKCKDASNQEVSGETEYFNEDEMLKFVTKILAIVIIESKNPAGVVPKLGQLLSAKGLIK